MPFAVVWSSLKNLELLSATPRATLTLLPYFLSFMRKGKLDCPKKASKFEEEETTTRKGAGEKTAKKTKQNRGLHFCLVPARQPVPLDM